MPKKSAAPAFKTDPELMGEFGFQEGDMVLTPLGVQVVILGIRPDADGSDKLWAQFPGGILSPLSPASVQARHTVGKRAIVAVKAGAKCNIFGVESRATPDTT